MNVKVLVCVLKTMATLLPITCDMSPCPAYCTVKVKVRGKGEARVSSWQRSVFDTTIVVCNAYCIDKGMPLLQYVS